MVSADSEKGSVSDPVNHPSHYTSHPSGVECITITEHMGFNLGSALKYVWRADLKGDAIQDLEKARWYIDRELALRNKPEPKATAVGGGVASEICLCRLDCCHDLPPHAHDKMGHSLYRVLP